MWGREREVSRLIKKEFTAAPEASRAMAGALHAVSSEDVLCLSPGGAGSGSLVDIPASW